MKKIRSGGLGYSDQYPPRLNEIIVKVKGRNIPSDTLIVLGEGESGVIYRNNKVHGPSTRKLNRAGRIFFFGGIHPVSRVLRGEDPDVWSYYVCRKSPFRLPWGTQQPIDFRECVRGTDEDGDSKMFNYVLRKIKMYGDVELCISDPGLFLETIVGDSLNHRERTFVVGDLKDKVQGQIMQSVRSCISGDMGDDFNDAGRRVMDDRINSYSEHIKGELNNILAAYGLTVNRFIIEGREFVSDHVTQILDTVRDDLVIAGMIDAIKRRLQINEAITESERIKIISDGVAYALEKTGTNINELQQYQLRLSELTVGSFDEYLRQAKRMNEAFLCIDSQKTAEEYIQKNRAEQ